MFEPYLQRWSLAIDGEAFSSPSGALLPVRQHGVAAMLKIAKAAEEQAGNRLMARWDGDGAAPVLACSGDGMALLMQRAQGPQSLAQMVAQGHDDEATHILCAAAMRLHAPRTAPAPPLVPLAQWFQALWPGAARHGGLFEHSARTARTLLAAPRDEGVLHGDIHHGNVLDFRSQGWLAIDPKGLRGECGFDFANILCNPDGATALAPGRFARRIDVIVGATGIERQRLLQWVLAWAGLSAIWMLEEDGDDPAGTLKVAQLAAAALGIAGY